MKTSDVDDHLAIPARLAIVASLALGQRLTFTGLREQTGLADGNLHVQTRRLLGAGYLLGERVRVGGRSVTRFELTERGRLAFLELIRRLREAAEGPFGSGRTGTAVGTGSGGGATGTSPRPRERSRVW
ncbi:MAG: transcriptional regulator [bacterium]|nr:transcriptional regulator [bacterium]